MRKMYVARVTFEDLEPRAFSDETSRNGPQTGDFTVSDKEIVVYDQNSHRNAIKMVTILRDTFWLHKYSRTHDSILDGDSIIARVGPGFISLC